MSPLTKRSVQTRGGKTASGQDLRHRLRLFVGYFASAGSAAPFENGVEVDRTKLAAPARAVGGFVEMDHRHLRRNVASAVPAVPRISRSDVDDRAVSLVPDTRVSILSTSLVAFTLNILLREIGMR